MTAVLPTPLPDELIYSICARFAWRYGYPSRKTVTSELFGLPTLTAVTDLPSGLNHILSALSPECEYTIDRLIDGHTLLPVYAPFQPRERLKRVREAMREFTPVFLKLGLMAGNVALPLFLRYCPMCVTDDQEQYGEAYWHRLHQAPGVEVCPRHVVLLEHSNVRTKNRQTRHEFVAAQAVIPDLPARSLDPYDAENKLLLDLACDVEWLLDCGGLNAGPQALHVRYLDLLAHKGMATYSGHVRVKKLLGAFTNFYSPEFLNKLGCSLDLGSDHNWLLRLVRSPRVAQPPVSQLLFVRFLGLTAETFFASLDPLPPFGTGPWPCLNGAADHYGQRYITQCKVTFTKDHGRPVGLFACTCGFTYTRSGPDYLPEDIFHFSRVPTFGPIWDRALLQWWQDPAVSLRELSRRLGVDPRTVCRQAARLDLPPKRPGSLPKPVPPPIRATIPNESWERKRQRYRSAWLEALAMYQKEGRTALRHRLPHVHTWLRRRDRRWFEMHLPPRQLSQLTAARVVWAERDVQLAEDVTISGQRLRQQPGRPVFITRTAIGRDIGHLALLHKHLDKLPQTAKALSAQVEAREAFAVRRILWAADMFCREGVMPKRWELERRGALRFSTIASPLIEETLVAILTAVQEETFFARNAAGKD